MAAGEMEADVMATVISARPLPAQQAPPGGPRRSKGGLGREHRGGPGLAPWGVVVIWGVLLVVLAAVGAGFGTSALVLEVSGSAAGLVLLLAAVVWLDRRLRPSRGWLHQPARVGGVFMLALTVMLAWLGLAFGGWLVMIAVVPLIAAAGLEIAARRNSRALAAAASESQLAARAQGTAGSDVAHAAAWPRQPAGSR